MSQSSRRGGRRCTGCLQALWSACSWCWSPRESWAPTDSRSAGREALIGASTPAADPLDPLTADEIQTAFTVIERSKRLGARHVLSDRQARRAGEGRGVVDAGGPVPRRAFANVFDHAANKLFEAIVDLRTKQLVSWTPRPESSPPSISASTRPPMRSRTRTGRSRRRCATAGSIRRTCTSTCGRPATRRRRPHRGRACSARSRSTGAICRTPTTARSKASSSRSTRTAARSSTSPTAGKGR